MPQFSARPPLHLSRVLLALGLIATLTPACAQTPQDQIETAPSLGALVQLLQAREAQPSTHLLLDAPEVMLPGDTEVQVRSALPGTRLLVLARGRHEASKTAATGMSGPPTLIRGRAIGEVIPSERLPRPIWLASVPIKAGLPAEAKLRVPLNETQTLTLFAHAQGRWWFVTREIKVGKAPAAR